MRRIVLFFIWALLFLPVRAYAGQDLALSQVRVSFTSSDDWKKLQVLNPQVVRRGLNSVDIIADVKTIETIASMNLPVEIIHPDLLAFHQSHLPSQSMGGYMTLDEINAYLDSINLLHPNIVSPKLNIGQSYEGRDMWAVKVSDYPDLDEDEPELLYTSCIHACEVMGPEVLMYFMDYLCDNYGIDASVTELVDNRELWFILVVNPDGYRYNETSAPNGGGIWRKNRRDNGNGTYGVDLNRNFGYKWGYDDIGSSPDPYDWNYRGTGPFSEPEAQNLRDFTLNHDFKMAIYCHTYGGGFLWPWGYTTDYTVDDDVYRMIGDTVGLMTGYEFLGTVAEVAHLSNGGADDWNYGEQSAKGKIFCIVPEIGSADLGFWPPPDSIDPISANLLEPNLFFARIADNVYGLRAPDRPELFVPDTAEISYTVSWAHDDTLNPAIEYELREQYGQSAVLDSAGTFDLWDTDGFSLSSERAFSEPTSFYSGAQPNAVTSMQSTDHYRVRSGDTLRFHTFYDIESDWDYAYVEVSVDGFTFTSIPGTITTESDPNGENLGHGITGSSGGWVEAVFDLSDHVGEDIFIRFSYRTSLYFLDEGFYIDNIYPLGIFDSSHYYAPLTDTQIVFVDKAGGIDYHYRIRAKDSESQWSEYSSPASVHIRQLYICGDANTDEVVNVSDAVYVIAYVFKGGPEPDPAEAGDANGDGVVNISDAVYVINYVFAGGPEPICP